jgi:pepF/M3 family oligoendopeptidase
VKTGTLPRWELETIYAGGLDSPALAADLEQLEKALAEIELHHGTGEAVARALGQAVELFNRAWLLSDTLGTFIDCILATDSYDEAAAKKQSALEMVQVRLTTAWTRFQGWLRLLGAALPAALAAPGPAASHAFVLEEAAEQGRWLMGGAEEALAAELSLPGANAWAKLQRTITSRISVPFTLDGEERSLPISSLINLRTHPDGEVRRRAWEAEMAEWEKVKEPLAACMNGVKGFAVTLDRRRGRADCLHAPIDRSRIDRPTLEALLEAMRGSLPMFGRYFRRKAERLGREKLPWWDLFAPTGAAGRGYGWEEARASILDTFGEFSPGLASLARRAFDERWIDAGPRDGKRGGAFCAAVPAVRQSRILCNFDGSLDQLFTVAHELGHAFHNECAWAAGRTPLQQVTPMTLAETASIMCENIVGSAVLSRVSDPREELALLENTLIGDAQVVVDIYSRFLFEKEVMERRARGELSAAELCDAMERAQEAAYGDALDGRYRHRWMWTWKPHYYAADLNFYNFPYAFGLLFATGLYAVYRRRGAAFVPDYQELLACTGMADAATLAARFGIDLRSRSFWDGSIEVIRGRVDRYCSL